MEQTRYGGYRQPVEGAHETTQSMSVPAPGARRYPSSGFPSCRTSTRAARAWC